MEAALDRAIESLHHRAKALESHLADVGIERLDKRGAFTFFRRLVNYDPARAARDLPGVDAASLTERAAFDLPSLVGATPAEAATRLTEQLDAAIAAGAAVLREQLSR